MVHKLNFACLYVLLLSVLFANGDAKKEHDFYVSIVTASSDRYFGIRVDKEGDLHTERVSSKLVKHSGSITNSNDFVDINKVYDEKFVNKVEASLRSSLQYCKSNSINLQQLPKGQSILGDASLDSSRRSISISPGRKYAIVKSSLEPYFLLNLSTLVFEKICIYNVVDVEWIDDYRVAVSYLDRNLPVHRNVRADSILSYQITKNKFEKTKFEASQIGGLIWLKKTDTFAVVVSKKSNHTGFFDSLLSTAGHPPEYDDFFIEHLDIYKKTRRAKVLKKKVKNGSSFIYRTKYSGNIKPSGTSKFILRNF